MWSAMRAFGLCLAEIVSDWILKASALLQQGDRRRQTQFSMTIFKARVVCSWVHSLTTISISESLFSFSLISFSLSLSVEPSPPRLNTHSLFLVYFALVLSFCPAQSCTHARLCSRESAHAHQPSHQTRFVRTQTCTALAAPRAPSCLCSVRGSYYNAKYKKVCAAVFVLNWVEPRWSAAAPTIFHQNN